MKKLLTTVIVLIMLSYIVYATTEVKDTIKRNISAYRYNIDDIFSTNTNPTTHFEVQDKALNPIFVGADITIPQTATVSETLLFNYSFSGNENGKHTIYFQFYPLMAEQSSTALPYKIKIQTTTATIGNIDFSNGNTVQLGHSYTNNDTTYVFNYTNIATVDAPIDVDSSYKEIKVKYELKTVTSDGTPNFNVVDHWVRKGSVYISIPPITDAALARYVACMKIIIEAGL